MTKVTRRSIISGVIRTIEIDQYTPEEFERRLKAWEDRKYLIQEAFPELSDDQREFIMTGITPVEWDEEFNKDEYDGDDYHGLDDDLSF